MALSASAVRATNTLRTLSLKPNGSSLVQQHRAFATSLILRNTDSTSFTRTKQTQIATTSTTSTTAQSTDTRRGTGYNALAKAEQKVAKQQKGMARQMPGMSLENQDQPLADPYILPPLHQVGISKVGGIVPAVKYMFQRTRRFLRLTISSMSDIVQKEPIIINLFASPEFAALPWYKRFWINLRRTRPTVSMQPLSDHLAEVWEKWNKAQASGDLATIRQISTSQALEIARTRAQNHPGGTAMTWTVNRYLAKPRAVDARVLPIDPAGQNMLAQVVIKLDTEQTVTIKPRSRAAQTLHSTATEYYAFEKLLSNNEARWRIKQKVTPYSGGELPKDLM